MRANRSHNLHSLAVHMRIVLECAAQVQSKAHAVYQGSERELKRVLNVSEYDFQYALGSLSRGGVGRDEVQRSIIVARARMGQVGRKSPTRVTVADKVGYLAQGKEWYDHLSKYFCDGDAAVLAGPSFFGGVKSISTAADELAFAIFLDYLAEQLITMLVGNGFLLIAVNGDSRPFDQAIALSNRKRSATPMFRETGEGRNEASQSDRCVVPRNIERISSRREAEEWLRSSCELRLAYLKELIAINLAIDEPKSTTTTSKPEHLLRLRKVCFHIRTITSCAVDSDALHVMGPDIRTARKYLEPMVKAHLYDGLGDHDLARQHRYLKGEENQLIFFSHPTPMTLIQARDRGGFGGPTIVSVFLKLYMMLSELAAGYGLGLGFMAEDVNRSKQSELLRVIDNANAESASFSLEAFLPFLEGGE